MSTEAFFQGFEKGAQAEPDFSLSNDDVFNYAEEGAAIGAPLGGATNAIWGKMTRNSSMIPYSTSARAVRGGLLGAGLMGFGGMLLDDDPEKKQAELQKAASRGFATAVDDFVNEAGNWSRLSGGAEGTAFAGKGGMGDFVKKEFDEVMGIGNARDRARVMNEFDIFPRVHAADDQTMIMDRMAKEIDGIGNEGWEVPSKYMNQMADQTDASVATQFHPFTDEVKEMGLRGGPADPLGIFKNQAVVHDLHADNVMLDQAGNPKIIDPIVGEMKGFWGQRGLAGMADDLVIDDVPNEVKALAATGLGGATLGAIGEGYGALTGGRKQ